MCTLIPKRMKQELDVTGVHMHNGDFKLNELQLAVNKEEITRAALKECLVEGVNRKKWLIFAASIEHADHIAEMLTSMGIHCEAYHSKQPQAKLDSILEEYSTGTLRAVVNNNCLTTGFDNPGIDLLVILRPIASVGLWIQILGRGTRALYAGCYDLSLKSTQMQAIQEEARSIHWCWTLHAIQQG